MKPQKQSARPEGGKKTYSKPGLQTYGSLTVITSKIGNSGNDNACRTPTDNSGTCN
jgi:hypothetical protein